MRFLTFDRQITVVLLTLMLSSSHTNHAQAQEPKANVEVPISGYVADLSGIPHTNPNISVTIKAVLSGEIIDTVKVNPQTGFFSFVIRNRPEFATDVRVSLSAEGTALINGVVTQVRTGGELFGLAGIIKPTLADLIEGKPKIFPQTIILVVPKANTGSCCRVAKCRRHHLFSCLR